ncbi:tetratricopeptide repeat protein [Desulfobacter hydrogenophilus]|nr:tetratricopeptide repeat protein [Desulfobacter hydrogenophilus]
MKQCMEGFTVFLFLITIFSGTAAYSQPKEAPQGACPDEQTLTRDARLFLSEAQKLMAENKLNQASKQLTQFIAQHPDENHAYVTFTLAGLNLEMGKMETAVAFYEKTLALCPAYAPAWQNLGKICYDLGRFERAAQALEKTWELTGRTNHTLRFHSAVARLSAKQPAKALPHLEFLTSGQAGPPEENWVKLMVQLSIENKKSAKALKTVERLLAIPNAKPYLLRLAASLNLALNNHKKAAQNLSAYGLITPLPLREQTLLADLYNNIGIPALAAKNYEKALALKSSLKLYERLASAWFDACEMNKALAAVKQGLKAYPHSHAMWKLKGWIHYEAKVFNKASSAFAKALVLNKKDAKSLFMHGLCACRAGHTDQARKILKQAAAHRRYKTQAMALIRQMDAVDTTKG